MDAFCVRIQTGVEIFWANKPKSLSDERSLTPDINMAYPIASSLCVAPQLSVQFNIRVDKLHG